MKKSVWVLFVLLFSLAGQSQSAGQTDVILNRYKTFLLATDTSLAHAKNIQPVSAGGFWPDIDYTNNEAGLWQVAEHLRRVRSLSLLWADSSSSYYHSPFIKNNITAALDYWGQHRYKSKNWWHNEIGVPQMMRDIIILLRDSLSNQQFKNAISIMAQYKLAGTGANLVWSADLGLHYGALTNNMALMQQCRDTILSVIKITTAEGVQPDYSYHQHGKRLQMYHYGGAFLLDNIRLAWELQPTALAFPKNKIQVLTDFVLNGWQWMARGINTVPGTIDRAASRHNALHSADIRKLMPFFYDVQPDSIRAFKNLYATQQNKATLKGYRYFPYADFTAYQQPDFSFFLKTTSNRTLLTEAINSENLQGALLNSGDAYFISNGKEYYNLMPVWDWDRLPGITNFISEKKDKIKQQMFVGNVSDSESGLAVMDYLLQKNEQSLKAHKFWATHNNVTVALIAGLQTDSLQQPAFTVLDQCRLQTKVTLNKPGNFLTAETNSFKNIQWVYQNKFVYIPLEKDSMVIQLKNAKGQWWTINNSESKAYIKEKVFLPSIIHDKNKKTSGYVVAFAATPVVAQKLAAIPTWKILKNNDSCQAVAFNDGILMAAFYTPASMSFLKSLQLAVSRPCLVLIKKNKVYLSDPAHKGGEVWGNFNKKQFHALLPADGTTVRVSL